MTNGEVDMTNGEADMTNGEADADRIKTGRAPGATPPIREVTVRELLSRCADIFDQVEDGITFLVTRRGRRVATLERIDDARQTRGDSRRAEFRIPPDQIPFEHSDGRDDVPDVTLNAVQRSILEAIAATPGKPWLPDPSPDGIVEMSAALGWMELEQLLTQVGARVAITPAGLRLARALNLEGGQPSSSDRAAATRCGDDSPYLS